jgi:hypothetical protein
MVDNVRHRTLQRPLDELELGADAAMNSKSRSTIEARAD